MALSEKQALFVREYLSVIPRNATAAYKRAGYKSTGHVAESGASQLLKNTEVRRAIDEAEQKANERTGITQDWVLSQLAERAKDTEEAGGARVRALELLGKNLGMWKEEDKPPFVVVITLEQAVRADQELDEWRQKRQLLR